MTKKYNQLTLEQRYKIEALRDNGSSCTAIAELIGVHKSTISRELRRNALRKGIGCSLYVATRADLKAKLRHRAKTKQLKFTAELKMEAKEMMTVSRYSPELVAAKWRKDGVNGVSHETIYKFVWYCKHTNKRENSDYKSLHKSLRHGRRRQKRGNYKDSRGLIPNRISIEARPAIVAKRRRYGDIEADFIMGKGHKSALLVTIDRKTLKTTINKLRRKEPRKVARILIDRMKTMPPIKTITFDNDIAFWYHEKVGKKLRAKTYFTRPYTSQDKGTIENRNGVIRMFFPKQTDFNNISTAEIKRVEKEINNRPIRKFGYLTANEVFLKQKGSVALLS
ncbi:MAG: IS30 family transposase [Bacteroidota bacterium]|nr:IS30 family transposase [Bacteroidota bacterium]